MRDYRFGVNMWEFASRSELVRMMRSAEGYCFDVVATSDHLGAGQRAAFPTLVAMAAATERVRVGTYVINTGFWQPHLLAREAATTDLLTDGRLELGLGAGFAKAEFDMAGIPWQPFRQRVTHIADTVTELIRLFSDSEAGYPVTGCTRPPLLIGGNSEEMLRLAALHADIVSLPGARQAPGMPIGMLQPLTEDEFAQRVAIFQKHAENRLDDIEVNLQFQAVIVTDNREQAAAGFGRRFGLDLPVGEILKIPVLLVGTESQILDRLSEYRNRYGITYFTVLQHYMDALGPIVRRLKG